MPLKGIKRRDFLSGAALTAAGLSTAPIEALQSSLASAEGAWTYPPAKTGMRGAHAGSFETAHALAWEGKTFKRPRKAKDRPYDLVIVGAGISGLSAAYMAQQKLGNKARILILDNHDDFGGHAKRNEFTVEGRRLIGYGGSQSIDGPSSYSPDAQAFLKSLTIETERFYRFFDQSYYRRKGLSNGLHLDAATYGEDRLLTRNVAAGFGQLFSWETESQRDDLARLIAALPLTGLDQTLLRRMLIEQEDWLVPGGREARAYLRGTSFEQCMRDAGLSENALTILRSDSQGFWGLGWDALSGLEAVRMGHPATYGLSVSVGDGLGDYGDEPYIFHFPDGNASIARLAVAALVPDAVTESDMDGIVQARVHYDRLDLPQNPVRMRLSSTVVEARNAGDTVEITYVRDGWTERVVARHAIMACWNNVLPYIMPEMAASQREAIAYAEKVPLSYINIALRTQRSLFEAGVAHVYSPNSLCANWSLDFPVSMGGYVFPKGPGDPALLHMVHCPVRPGLPAREQHQKGRMDLYGLSFEDYEAAIVSQLQGALGHVGFDAERDIAAITVNRWPHGYTYEYNELFDPHDWSPSKGPHIEGSRKIGHIAIANADASGYAYVDGAIDAAARAVENLF